jgi:hypothetical protein
VLEIFPLIPKNQWDWFILDQVSYHNKTLTILWDKTGKKYNKGKGLLVFVDGKEIYKGKDLKPLKVKIN